MWSARVTRWNALTGSYIEVVGGILYPIDIALCYAGHSGGIVAAEYLADRYGL